MVAETDPDHVAMAMAMAMAMGALGDWSARRRRPANREPAPRASGRPGARALSRRSGPRTSAARLGQAARGTLNTVARASS